MTTSPVLNKTQIDQFEGFAKSQSRYNVIQKILKVASLILLGATICLFGSVFLLHISSHLILGLGVSSAILTGFFLMSKLIVLIFHSNLKKPDKISPESVIDTLDSYNSKIPSLDPKKYIGKVEKIDLEKGSKIIIKADIHGDYFSLIEHLKSLQKQGYLDDNFNVKSQYKGKIIIAFLGDYLDRGEYSFEVATLLMKLKVNNPNEIVLLKGNHENLSISKLYIHRNEHHYYHNEKLCEKLERFFNSLPLALFVGAKDDKNKYQYTCLTHGAIDPDIDANEVLNTWGNRATMYIRKDKKATLSDRIKNILPKHLQNKKIEEIKIVIKALESFIKSKTENDLKNLKTLLKTSNIDRKKAKNILSCLRVQGFLLTSYSFQTPIGEEDYVNGAARIEDERKNQSLTNFNWGDITLNYIDLNIYRGVGFCFTPEFIKDYFRVISTENRKVKALRAGHAHCHKRFSINGKKGFIEILPVAGEIEGYDRIRKPTDISEVATVYPKVKDWKQNMFSRKRANLHTSISKETRFFMPKQHGIFNFLG